MHSKHTWRRPSQNYVLPPSRKLSDALPLYLVSVLAHVYFKNDASDDSLFPPSIISIYFFIRPLGVPIDCVTSFEILPQSTLDFTRFKTTECSSNKLHIVAINRQVHFKLANTLTPPAPLHIHAPESPVSMIMHSCQSRCCVTKQISDLTLSQTFKKLKQVFKAKGIVKAFQTPLLHS